MSKVEVLIVDDQERAASSLARLVEVRTGLGAIATADPELAVQYVREMPIKVAVLDQRMPEITGTALSTKLRAISPGLRVVMFTGEASGAEVAEAAYSKNFDDVLQKAEVDRLTAVIFEQYWEYRVQAEERSRTSVAKLFETRREYVVFGPKVAYFLLDLRVVNERYVNPADWETVLQLSRGQEDKRSTSWTTKRTVTIERQSQATFAAGLKGGLTGRVASLQLALDHSISELRKETHVDEASETTSHEVTFRLPDQETGVRARHFQRAPVFRQWVALIRIDCGCCKTAHEERVVVNESLPAYATQQVDYLSDGKVETHFTGFLKAKFS